MAMNSLKTWLIASRPKTLIAAVIPIFVGTALAIAEGKTWHLNISILALLAALFIQIGTNFVNDAVDFKKGADTEKRIGPQRVTQSGLMSSEQVMKVAAGFFFLAFLCGIPLVLSGGWPIVIIGLLSIAMGYGYTAGPFPLAYKGLGDIFVVLFFGLIAVGGVYFLQAQELSISAIIAGLQVGFHCTVLIAINNLRDVHGDILVDKKTLAVRFGKQFGRWEIAVLCGVPFLIGIYWALHGFLWAFLLPWIVCPLAIGLSTAIFRTEPSPVYNQFLAKGAALHLIFGTLLSVGLLL